jgi:hypothetical protein
MSVQNYRGLRVYPASRWDQCRVDGVFPGLPVRIESTVVEILSYE